MAPAADSSDPATAVRQDTATLSSSIQAAQALLLPDLQVLQGDVQRHAAAAVKRDITKLKADSKRLLPVVKRNRKQLVDDMDAARAAGVAVHGTLAGGPGADATLSRLRTLQKQLRNGLKSSRAAGLKVAKPAHVHTPKQKPAHVHTPKHTHFVKHQHVRQHIKKTHLRPHLHPGHPNLPKHAKRPAPTPHTAKKK